MNSEENGLAVYRRGAADGAMLGAYFSLMCLASAMSMQMPVVGLVGTCMAILVPVVAFVMMRRGDRADGHTLTFSGLWLHGIIMFLCGSLIMAVVMYVFMRFVKPGFIVAQLREVIAIYRDMGNPDATALADSMQQLITRKMVPSAASVATSLIWLGSFSGSILSLILALIVKALRPRRGT